MKRHWVAEWVREHDPHICCLKATNLRKKIPTQTESEMLGENISNKWTGGKSWEIGVVILISDKIDFKKKP